MKDLLTKVVLKTDLDALARKVDLEDLLTKVALKTDFNALASKAALEDLEKKIESDNEKNRKESIEIKERQIVTENIEFRKQAEESHKICRELTGIKKNTIEDKYIEKLEYMSCNLYSLITYRKKEKLYNTLMIKNMAMLIACKIHNSKKKFSAILNELLKNEKLKKEIVQSLNEQNGTNILGKIQRLYEEIKHKVQ